MATLATTPTSGWQRQKPGLDSFPSQASDSTNTFIYGTVQPIPSVGYSTITVQKKKC